MSNEVVNTLAGIVNHWPLILFIILAMNVLIGFSEEWRLLNWNSPWWSSKVEYSVALTSAALFPMRSPIEIHDKKAIYSYKKDLVSSVDYLRFPDYYSVLYSFRKAIVFWTLCGVWVTASYAAAIVLPTLPGLALVILATWQAILLLQDWRRTQSSNTKQIRSLLNGSIRNRRDLNRINVQLLDGVATPITIFAALVLCTSVVPIIFRANQYFPLFEVIGDPQKNVLHQGWGYLVLIVYSMLEVLDFVRMLPLLGFSPESQVLKPIGWQGEATLTLVRTLYGGLLITFIYRTGSSYIKKTREGLQDGLAGNAFVGDFFIQSNEHELVMNTISSFFSDKSLTEDADEEVQIQRKNSLICIALLPDSYSMKRRVDNLIHRVLKHDSIDMDLKTKALQAYIYYNINQINSAWPERVGKIRLSQASKDFKDLQSIYQRGETLLPDEKLVKTYLNFDQYKESLNLRAELLTKSRARDFDDDTIGAFLVSTLKESHLPLRYAELAIDKLPLYENAATIDAITTVASNPLEMKYLRKRAMFALSYFSNIDPKIEGTLVGMLTKSRTGRDPDIVAASISTLCRLCKASQLEKILDALFTLSPRSRRSSSSRYELMIEAASNLHAFLPNNLDVLREQIRLFASRGEREAEFIDNLIREVGLPPALALARGNEGNSKALFAIVGPFRRKMFPKLRRPLEI